MANYLLIEDGFYLLLESGDKILLEQQPTSNPPSSPLIPTVRDASIPVFIINEDSNISVTVSPTDASLYTQGNTYNQTGLTYDDVNTAYGGVYHADQDIVPLVSLAENITPLLI